MSDEWKAVIIAAIVSGVICFIIGANLGSDAGWSRSYRAMKAGTIEKEMQQRAPALWIELNTKKAEK